MLICIKNCARKFQFRFPREFETNICRTQELKKKKTKNQSRAMARTRHRQDFCEDKNRRADRKKAVVSMVRAARHQSWHSLPSYLIYSSIQQNRMNKSPRKFKLCIENNRVFTLRTRLQLMICFCVLKTTRQFTKWVFSNSASLKTSDVFVDIHHIKFMLVEWNCSNDALRLLLWI